jgi:putative tricarboxylic transport membrane protein
LSSSSDYPHIRCIPPDVIRVGVHIGVELSIPLVGIFVRFVHVRHCPGTYHGHDARGLHDQQQHLRQWLVTFFSAVGYMMKKSGFEPEPLIMTFVLGRTLETSFRQSLRIFEGYVTGFLTRPISGPLVALMILVVIILPAFQFIRRRGQGSSD